VLEIPQTALAMSADEVEEILEEHARAHPACPRRGLARSGGPRGHGPGGARHRCRAARDAVRVLR
jgi:hypothetical protein